MEFVKLDDHLIIVVNLISPNRGVETSGDASKRPRAGRETSDLLIFPRINFSRPTSF